MFLFQWDTEETVHHRIPNRPVIGIDNFPEQCTCKCIPPFQSIPHSPASVANLSGCLYPCHSPEINPADHKFLTAWIATW